MSEESQPSEPQNDNLPDVPFRPPVPANEELTSRALGSPHDSSDTPTLSLRWNVLVSWLVIVGVVALQVAMHQVSTKSDEENGEGSVAIMDVKFEAKMALFLESFESTVENEQRPKSSSARDVINQNQGGSVQSRLARAIMLAYFNDQVGAVEALNNVERTIEDCDYVPTTTQQRLIQITRKLLDSSAAEYATPEPSQDGDLIEDETGDGMPDDSLAIAADDDTVLGSSISAEDQKFFVEQFGWIGELGLHLRDNQRESIRQGVIGGAMLAFIGMIALGGVGVLWAITGLIAGIVFVVFVVTRGFSSRFEGHPQRSAVYLETFAIWMVVLVGSQIAVALVARILSGAEGETAEVMSWAMHLMPIAFLGSLFVLVWPMLRGVSVGDLRRDIGWYGNPFVESFWGLCGHAASFLFLLGAFLTTLGIVQFMNWLKPVSDELAGVQSMGHPIQEALGGQMSLIMVVFFLTVVCAPIVEETFFRGVFYRYLRDAWRGGALVFKIGFATLLNSVIFAAIHPQGIAGVPILAALAIVLSLIRENRGSLWGSMAVHAAHNFFVTMMAFMVLS